MTAPEGRPTGALARWALLGLIVFACLPVAVGAGFFGFLAGGDFASGGRAPVRSALFWGVSAIAAAAPGGLLPSLGFRVRRGTALTAAGAIALVWSVAGFAISAQ